MKIVPGIDPAYTYEYPEFASELLGVLFTMHIAGPYPKSAELELCAHMCVGGEGPITCILK